MTDAFAGRIGRTYSESEPAWPPTITARPGAPNIIVVLLDDMGFSDIGPFGSEIATPTLDRLAERGVRLTNYHTAAVCSPARAALMTGLNPHRAGFAHVASRDIGFPGYTMEIAEDVLTLPEISAGVGLRHVRGGQVAPVARQPDARRRRPTLVARPARLRPLLRLHGGLHQLLQSEPIGRRQQPAGNRPAPRRLLPHGRPDRSRDRHAQGLTGARFEKALFPVLRAPRRARPVRRQSTRTSSAIEVGTARVGTACGSSASGVSSTWACFLRAPGSRRATPNRASTSKPGRTCSSGAAGAVRQVPGGVRGDGRQRRSEPRSLAGHGRGLRPTGQHHRRLHVRQRCDRRGRSGRHAQLLQSVSRAGDARGLATRRAARSRADRRTAHLDPLPARLGHGVQHAVSAVQEPHVRGWGARAVHPVLARRPRRARDPKSVPVRHGPARDAAGSGGASSGQRIARGSAAKGIDGVSFRSVLGDPDAPSTRFEQYAESGGNRGFYRDGWKLLTRHDVRAPYTNEEWQLFDVRADPTELDDVAEQFPDKVRELADAWEAAASENSVFPLTGREHAARRASTGGGDVRAARAPAARHADGGALPREPADRGALVRRLDRARPSPRCGRRARGARRPGRRLLGVRGGRPRASGVQRVRRPEGARRRTDARRNACRPAGRRGAARLLLDVQPAGRWRRSRPARGPQHAGRPVPLRRHRRRNRSPLARPLGRLRTPRHLPLQRRLTRRHLHPRREARHAAPLSGPHEDRARPAAHRQRS